MKLKNYMNCLFHNLLCCEQGGGNFISKIDFFIFYKLIINKTIIHRKNVSDYKNKDGISCLSY